MTRLISDTDVVLVQAALNMAVSEALEGVHPLQQVSVVEAASDKFLEGTGWEYRIMEIIGDKPRAYLTGYDDRKNLK